MITDQERKQKRAEGYDFGFEYNDKKYWIDTTEWNEEKEEQLNRETGLHTFREKTGNRKLVIFNPRYFEVVDKGSDFEHLHYKGSESSNIPQPLNMSSGFSMFLGCKKLTTLDLSNWDVSELRDMCHMFSTCKNLSTLNLTGWCTSKIKYLSEMFRGCVNLTHLDLGNWDVTGVDDMYCMFYGCNSLYSLNLENWDVSQVSKVGNTFFRCDHLQLKYVTEDNQELLQKIIEDSNKNNNLSSMNLF